jgi:hypothetical protein
MCDLAKIFFTSKFSYLFFSNPANKTETGTPNRWGTTNSKPPGPIIMMDQSETLSAVRSHLLHSFLQVHSVAAPITSYGNLWCGIMLSENHFHEPNWHIWTFFI